MGNCKDYHVNSCDCIIRWSDLLGSPSDNKQLKDYINGLLQDLIGSLGSDVDGKIENLTDALVDRIKDQLLDQELDAYQIKYLETTVGNALDELRKIKLQGTIVEPFKFEKGEKVYKLKVGWTLNKPVVSQTMKVHRMSGIETVEIPVDETVYIDPFVNGDTNYVLEIVDIDGQELTLETSAKFYLAYYVGPCSAKRISNTEVLALNKRLALPEDTHYTNIFNCRGGHYMWWIFPYELHKYYDFFTNKMKDTDYVYTVDNVKNQYGYTHEYLFIRSNNIQTALTIYSEVHAHEFN